MALAFLFFYYISSIGHYIWPKLLNQFKLYDLNVPKALTILNVGYLWVLIITINLGLWFIYHIEHPFFEKYKVNNEPWPWNKNIQKWNKLICKTLLIVGFNAFIMLPLVAMIGYIGNDYNISHTYDIETLPDTKTMIFSIIFCMICEDFAFHWIHKMLHLPIIYPYIHKIHHEYSTTIGIAHYYFHPIEYVFSGLFPAILGPALLGTRMHLFTNLVWSGLRTAESLDGHSGYEFSWSPYRLIPFSGSATYHDFHHLYNLGNFSSFFSLWDTICGTNKKYYELHE